MQTGLQHPPPLLWPPECEDYTGVKHIGLTSVSLRAVNLLLVGVPTVLWCREFPDLQFDSVLLK